MFSHKLPGPVTTKHTHARGLAKIKYFSLVSIQQQKMGIKNRGYGTITISVWFCGRFKNRIKYLYTLVFNHRNYLERC